MRAATHDLFFMSFGLDDLGFDTQNGTSVSLGHTQWVPQIVYPKKRSRNVKPYVHVFCTVLLLDARPQGTLHLLS